MTFGVWLFGHAMLNPSQVVLHDKPFVFETEVLSGEQ
jgi:hypothetical protein